MISLSKILNFDCILGGAKFTNDFTGVLLLISASPSNKLWMPPKHGKYYHNFIQILSIYCDMLGKTPKKACLCHAISITALQLLLSESQSIPHLVICLKIWRTVFYCLKGTTTLSVSFDFCVRFFIHIGLWQYKY